MRTFLKAAIFSGALGLVAVSPAYAGTLDQEQTEYGAVDIGLNGPDRVAAQTFTAGLTGELDQVDLPVGYTENCQPPAGDLIVQIRTTLANGQPSGTVLASASLAGSAMGEQAGPLTEFVSVAFSSPASVTAGTTYAIVLSAPEAGGCAATGARGAALEPVYYEWQLAGDNPYPPGAAHFSTTGGATWSTTYATYDAGFRTYVAPPDTQPPDTDPPEATITEHPKNKIDKRKAKFKFTSNEPGSTFECKKDRKPWKPCSSPTKMKRLDEGKHKFKVRATDAAGNTGKPDKDRFRVVG